MIKPGTFLKLIYDATSGNGRSTLVETVDEVSSQASDQTWLTAPGGNTTVFGHIPHIEDRYDRERCCPAGEIKLLVGDIASGFVHLNAPKRKGRFGQLGPVNFVHTVTTGYDEIWVQQGRGGLLLLRRDANKAVIVSRDLVEGAYTIVTAFPLERSHNFKKRREVRVWPRTGW